MNGIIGLKDGVLQPVVTGSYNYSLYILFLVGIECTGKICAKRACTAVGHKYNINIYKYIHNSAFCVGRK